MTPISHYTFFCGSIRGGLDLKDGFLAAKVFSWRRSKFHCTLDECGNKKITNLQKKINMPTFVECLPFSKKWLSEGYEHLGVDYFHPQQINYYKIWGLTPPPPYQCWNCFHQYIFYVEIAFQERKSEHNSLAFETTRQKIFLNHHKIDGNP